MECFKNCSVSSSKFSNQGSIFLLHCQASTVITVHITFQVLFACLWNQTLPILSVCDFINIHHSFLCGWLSSRTFKSGDVQCTCPVAQLSGTEFIDISFCCYAALLCNIYSVNYIHFGIHSQFYLCVTLIAFH